MPQGGAEKTVKVWDLIVRVAHWSLVISIALAWYTSEGFGVWHDYTGYLALAIVIARVCWGFTGSKYARFSQFIRSVPDTVRYARDVSAGTQRRYLGHNPLAGWMALALLIMTLLTGLSGWLYTTDAYWGVEWVEQLHATLAYIMLPLILLHVIGSVVTSLHHKENLVTAMLHGKKHAPRDGDVV